MVSFDEKAIANLARLNKILVRPGYFHLLRLILRYNGSCTVGAAGEIDSVRPAAGGSSDARSLAERTCANNSFVAIKVLRNADLIKSEDDDSPALVNRSYLLDLLYFQQRLLGAAAALPPLDALAFRDALRPWEEYLLSMLAYPYKVKVVAALSDGKVHTGEQLLEAVQVEGRPIGRQTLTWHMSDLIRYEEKGPLRYVSAIGIPAVRTYQRNTPTYAKAVSVTKRLIRLFS